MENKHNNIQYKQSGTYKQSKHKHKRKSNGTITGDKGTEPSRKICILTTSNRYELKKLMSDT